MNLTSLTTKDWHSRAAGVRYETRHFIDGRYVDSIAGGRFTVVNPATGTPLCEVSAGMAADIDAAVAAGSLLTTMSWSAASPNDSTGSTLRPRRAVFDSTRRPIIAIISTWSTRPQAADCYAPGARGVPWRSDDRKMRRVYG